MRTKLDIYVVLLIPMFHSSLAPVVCRRAHVLFTLFVFVCVKWCPTRVLCCCFVFLRLVLPVSLECPFLIAPSIFSNVYLQISLSEKVKIFISRYMQDNFKIKVKVLPLNQIKHKNPGDKLMSCIKRHFLSNSIKYLSM